MRKWLASTIIGLMDFCEVLRFPEEWPRFWRRLMLYTLPVSLVVWVLVGLLSIALTLFLALSVSPLVWLIELIEGLAQDTVNDDYRD